MLEEKLEDMQLDIDALKNVILDEVNGKSILDKSLGVRERLLKFGIGDRITANKKGRSTMAIKQDIK